VVGRLEVSDLKAEVLCSEVLLRAERDGEGDPNRGVGLLSRHNAEEGLVALWEPLEVEVPARRGCCVPLPAGRTCSDLASYLSAGGVATPCEDELTLAWHRRSSRGESP
jgi:hypothetical protein